jgi:hypothetical protein
VSVVPVPRSPEAGPAARFAELDDAAWPFRATELAALIAWSRGKIDRAGFRRWLRSEGWPEDDLDDLTGLLEHLASVDRRVPMPRRNGDGATP